MKPTKRFLPLVTSLLVMAAGLYLGSRLEMDNDISSLLPDSSKEMTRTSRALTRMMSRTVVDIATERDELGPNRVGPDELGRIADEFAERLTATKLVSDVRARMGMDDALPLLETLQDRAPLLFDDSALREIEPSLQPEQAIPKIQKLARDIQQIDGQHLRARAAIDPLGLTNRVTAQLQALGDQFQQARLIDGRMLSADEKHLLVLVEVAFAPNDTDNNTKFQAAMKRIVADLESAPENAGVRIRHFGAHRATLDNVTQIKSDVYRTSSIGIGVVALLAILCFGRIWLAMLALMPATFGGIFALGACSLFKDEMSGAVLGFGAVLLGLTIDFAVHVLFRIDRSGDKKRIELPVRALYMGGVTTSLAFVALLASSLPALRDIGIFGAVGIFSAVIFALYVLPTLVFGPKRAKPILDLQRVVKKIARPAIPSMLVALAATPIIAIGIFLLEFDGDPTNLSALSAASAEDERAIESVWGQNGQIAALVVEGEDLDAALTANDRLREWLDSLPEDAFRRHSSISGLLPSLATQRQRLQAWRGFWSSDRVAELKATLAQASEQSIFNETAFEPFVDWIEEWNGAEPRLLTYEEQRDGPMQPLLADRVYQENDSWRVSTPVFTEGWDQVAALDARLREEMPEVTLLNRQAFSRKLASMVTGEVWTLGLLAFMLVGTVVFMWHGRILITLAILLPLLMALTWSLGLLGWFGIPISLANAIFVVFLFGVAVDYAIFLASSRLDLFRTGEDRTTEAQASVLLCTLTTCGGFGSLVFAGHPVMHSIGLTALIGILATAVTTQVFVPALTMALLRRGGPNGTPGVANIRAGFWVCRTMVLRGLWQMARSRRGDPAENRRAAVDSIQRMSVRIREKLKFGERRYVDEDKLLTEPCIFVANHESMYDIVAVLALPRPTQVLAKDWVWRAPIMGRMVKAAGYVRSDASDPEQVFADVRDRIETGHSVLVFPEGKRTRTGRIGRFHNGAFAMARELGVKVQPIAMVNTREVVPYKTWWLGDHNARVCVLDAMDPAEFPGDDGDRRMARAARDRIRDRCRSLWLDTQFGPRWHAIISGMYRYLGPMVTHYAVSKCKLDPLMKELPRLCEGDGRVLIAGGGFGLMTSRIALAFPERPISCLDLDERKLQLAHAALGDQFPVDFVVGDLRDMELPESGLALLIDVLHYWDRETQRTILRRVGSALPIGGRLLFRDGCSTGDNRHKAVLVQEFIAVVTGFTRNQGRLMFRSEAQWTALLEECGFEIEEVRPDLGSFSNVVLICRKRREVTEMLPASN